MPRVDRLHLPLPPLPHRDHWTPGHGGDTRRGAAKYGSRPGETEYAYRVGLVAELIIRGKSRADVIRYVAETTDWDVSDRTIDAYMQGGRETIGAAPLESAAQTTRTLIRRFELIFERCIEKGDERTALRAVRELATFRGVGRMNRARLAAMAAGTEPPEPGDETNAPPTDVQRAKVVSDLMAIAKSRAVASGAVTLATGSDGDN
jgi:hypothetical protein